MVCTCWSWYALSNRCHSGVTSYRSPVVVFCIHCVGVASLSAPHDNRTKCACVPSTNGLAWRAVRSFSIRVSLLRRFIGSACGVLLVCGGSVVGLWWVCGGCLVGRLWYCAGVDSFNVERMRAPNHSDTLRL